MSQANIPNITPIITITAGQAYTLLLTSIALEELSLAHIVNSEAEKIQYVLGTLSPGQPAVFPTISDLLTINESVIQTLDSVIKKEMLLQMKLEHVLNAVNRQ
ncbi:hypothetical protein [Paenibacillus contaminans]|uniref:Uncharacterized protein n=1 Tax=Paenibacillus contaminans TaxID=450362 RepID=A0A329MSZ1_9BACL|nr:hypothetical protein [Paenibacillus contaminans]RAV22924.1 hypothetical protein DQG23_01590 [Paenibacillus contaminans]